jgi:hypothetical protein
MRADKMGMRRGTRVRRRTIAVAVAAILMGVQANAVAGAGETAADDPVKIGPGASGRDPASRIERQTPGREPEWAATVPDVAEREVELDSRTLAVGTSLAAAASTSQAPDSGSLSPGTYEGTVTIDVAYYTRCKTGDGTLTYAGTRTYPMDAEVIVSARAEQDGARERSPFNLIAGSELGVEASTQITSATVATDQRNKQNILIDYWDIDQSGREIRGTLTNRTPGLYLNTMQTMRPLGHPCQTVTPRMPVMVAIAEGAKLSGTVTNSSIELELLAQTIDSERRIRADFDVERR